MKGIFAPQPRPKAAFRLFCLPYAGGSSATFLDWPRLLPEDIELVCIDPPGRAERIGEAPVPKVLPLVRQLAGELRGWLDRPFGLFGHSNGALVAFELARCLQGAGTAPALLVAAAKAAPSLLQEPEALHLLPDDEFMAELQDSGATPDEFFESPELIELFLPLLRADYGLSETYRYRPGEPLRAELVLLSGAEDDSMTPADREAWARECSGSCRWHEVRGDHFFVTHSPEAVTALISAAITRICK